MIYRVAERAVGWWLGSGHGRPAGGEARRPPKLSRNVVFYFFIDVPRRLLCLETLSGGVGGGPLSLNPLPAPVSAEGITDTEMLIFDGRVAKYGPGQKKESFCPIPGNNSIFAGRRFVCTRSDFLSLGSFFFKLWFPIPRDMAPK